MNISIRKFLLINLLLTIIVTTIVTSAGNYYLDKRDIKKHLDELLRHASLNVEALLGDNFPQRDLGALQANLSAIPERSSMLSDRMNDIHKARTYNKYQFQIWDQTHKLLLHTVAAPNVILSDGKEGFGDVNVNKTQWRTFTKFNPDLGIYITVAEKANERLLLANRIAIDDIYIMLITYPIAGLLIWGIVGRGLSSIRRVADEVSHRVPNYLEPVDADSVPTEIKPLVVELNKLFLRLQQAIEREKRFAGDAAHELRTPLAALKTQVQVALKANKEKERKKLLHNVIAAVDRCTHVVQQLLTLSRIVPESNTLSDTAPFNLAKLSAEIIAQLVPFAIDKKIEIELFADEKNAIIDGNITAMSILIRNLVDNAIRYTPEGGEIKVFVNSVDEKVILKVQDNGPGIPAELRARVFERFFRVLGNKSPGSGLGLAIVQQIAQLHAAQLKLGPPSSGKGLEVEVIFKKQHCYPAKI